MSIIVLSQCLILELEVYILEPFLFIYFTFNCDFSIFFSPTIELVNEEHNKGAIIFGTQCRNLQNAFLNLKIKRS